MVARAPHKPDWKEIFAEHISDRVLASSWESLRLTARPPCCSSALLQLLSSLAVIWAPASYIAVISLTSHLLALSFRLDTVAPSLRRDTIWSLHGHLEGGWLGLQG